MSAPAEPDHESMPRIFAVVGPTASGKSELALDLAEAVGGEVVGADAMQFYRGMDIGTAKLPPSQRRGIRHHLIDVLDPRDEASASWYQTAAREAIDDIRSRGLHPIVTGGSGLYVRAALDHLEIPPTDPEVRARLEADAKERGGDAMYAALTRLDPAAAQAIQPNNTRRVIRALEVIELTGRPFSATMPTRTHMHPTTMIGVSRAREELDQRIDARVVQMWADGLVDEVRGLLASGIREGRTASRALGYSQALAQLDGKMTAAEAQRETASATRRYARRQESWFRPDPRITWVNPASWTIKDMKVGP